MNIRSFEAASKYLGAKAERPAGNNTRIRRIGPEAIVLVLHGSDIIRWTPAGTVLNSCGYRTHTTKERLNSFGPEAFRVYQERGQWNLAHWPSRREWIFADGIEVTASGDVLGAGDESDRLELQHVRRQIKRYVRGYMDALLAGKIEAPNAGDCWYCATKFGGSDHLRSHLGESYYFGSLLIRAIEFSPVSTIARARLAELWGGKPAEDATVQPGAERHENVFDGILLQQAGKSLTKYLRVQLGLGG